MIETISRTEKSDLLLALALAFDSRTNAAGSGAGAENAFAGSEKFFAALSREDAELLRARAGYFERLPPEKQQIWQKFRLDKIRRRGIAERLDANVHPLQIAGKLAREPKTVQLLVLRNLPEKLSRTIAQNLDPKPSEREFSADPAGPNQPVSDEIVDLIRTRFVSDFVALEDIFEPTDTDRIPIHKFDDFIRHLGVRETAIACRGISSKETLAAFLNRFDEATAIEIAGNITELDNVKPVWVERADRLLRKTLEKGFDPETLPRSLGFEILAIAFVPRDAAARRYAAQKMTPAEAVDWLASVAEGEAEHAAAESERPITERRMRVVERIAANFV